MKNVLFVHVNREEYYDVERWLRSDQTWKVD